MNRSEHHLSRAVIAICLSLSTACSGATAGSPPVADASSATSASPTQSNPQPDVKPLSAIRDLTLQAQEELALALRGGQADLAAAQLADRVDSIDSRLKETSQKLGRTTFDPAAIIEQVGRGSVGSSR